MEAFSWKMQRDWKWGEEWVFSYGDNHVIMLQLFSSWIFLFKIVVTGLRGVQFGL